MKTKITQAKICFIALVISFMMSSCIKNDTTSVSPKPNSERITNDATLSVNNTSFVNSVANAGVNYTISPVQGNYTTSPTTPYVGSCGAFSGGNLKSKVISSNGDTFVIRVESINQKPFGGVGFGYIFANDVCPNSAGTNQAGKITITSAMSSYWYLDFTITATFSSGTVSFYPVIIVPSKSIKWSGEPIKITAIPTSQSPVRPFSNMSGSRSDFGASKNGGTHTGIDYTAVLSTGIVSVGRGKVHSYTGASHEGFGALNPQKNGSCIWIEYRLDSGEPIYVLFGHIANSWVDKYPSLAYTLNLRAGDWVNSGQSIANVAPFYNSGKIAQHLHLGVFKPKKKADGSYYGLPSTGWGYGTTSRTEGDFLNPEDFFNYKLKISW